MTCLTNRERELVALGAALGSNCVPCIDYHIPESRKAGLTEAEILEAIQLAEKVRQVPAKKVLATAMKWLQTDSGKTTGDECAGSCGCDVTGGEARKTEPGSTGTQTMDAMSNMMAGMMASCAGFARQSAPGIPADGVKGCGCK